MADDSNDLEEAGIPYLTADGYADFHASGRHSHITELLRSGASLAEAKELARHTDIRMTMKYTHIGLDDQAKALTGLPNLSSALQHLRSDSWEVKAAQQQMRSDSCDTSSPELAQSDAQSGDTLRVNGDQSTVLSSNSDVKWPSLAHTVLEAQNYARQDSNLQPRDSVSRRFPGGLDFPITLELRLSPSSVGWRPSSLYTFPRNFSSDCREDMCHATADRSFVPRAWLGIALS
ncbi:tyrosine-type recombinase/integrase [bacterium]|nr:tyrosine-type recombinase/integrase [bacterium]